MKILQYNELGGAAKEKYVNHAYLLISKGYVSNVSVEVLAEKIYNSKIQVLGLEAEASKSISFFDYDKDNILKEVEKKEPDDFGSSW